MQALTSQSVNAPLKDQCPVAAADIVRNLRSEAFVVHQEKVNFPDVADQQLLQAIGEEVTGLIANRGVRRQQASTTHTNLPSCCCRNQSALKS